MALRGLAAVGEVGVEEEVEFHMILPLIPRTKTEYPESVKDA